jgi:hypothetical protein
VLPRTSASYVTREFRYPDTIGVSGYENLPGIEVGIRVGIRGNQLLIPAEP